ncbi:MAG TPA: hypothetical protein VFY17_01735 [Pilimelia sp.]|nr:hypothetical protein [Pilimelia sp.]
MEFLLHVLRFLHLVGFAFLLGGALTQLLTGPLRIHRTMLWGAVLQLLTGVALAAPLRGGGDAEPDPVKLGVKLLVAVLIFVMVFCSRRREVVARGHFLAIVGLTVLNGMIATFWR